jgi:hypothetical protein
MKKIQNSHAKFCLVTASPTAMQKAMGFDDQE